MTKKQLKRMLITEGVYYWMILLTALLSVGTLITSGAGLIIKKSLPYFKFVYPVEEFIVTAIILLVFCVLFPQAVYKKTLKKSAIEQLRKD